MKTVASGNTLAGSSEVSLCGRSCSSRKHGGPAIGNTNEPSISVAYCRARSMPLWRFSAPTLAMVFAGRS